jgi:nucleotide-binding universal stress UspA family protein
MYRHILIPTDGSELAQRAVPHGLTLAKAVGAKVTAVTVEHTFNLYSVPESKINLMPKEFAEYTANIKQHAAMILNGVVQAANAAGVPCETLQMVHEHPYQAIIKAANENGCDLIVMASHGRSGSAATLIGSVTIKVITHTKIPVLVCH